MFTLELLQAINNWQKGALGIGKDTLAENVKKHSVKLPLKFKTLEGVCYRKIHLKGDNILKIGIDFKIPETYSSWTFESSIAEKFNIVIPTKKSGRIGFIFEWNPTQFPNFEVIINLNEVFQSIEFQKACNDFESSIYDFHLGIGKYKNAQQEIILKISELKIEQIWAYGSYKTSTDEFVQKYLSRKTNQKQKPTNKQKEAVVNLLKMRGINRKEMWLTKEKNPTKVQELIEKNKVFALSLMLKKKQEIIDSAINSNPYRSNKT